MWRLNSRVQQAAVSMVGVLVLLGGKGGKASASVTEQSFISGASLPTANGSEPGNAVSEARLLSRLLDLIPLETLKARAQEELRTIWSFEASVMGMQSEIEKRLVVRDGYLVRFNVYHVAQVNLLASVIGSAVSGGLLLKGTVFDSRFRRVIKYNLRFPSLSTWRAIQADYHRAFQFETKGNRYASRGFLLSAVGIAGSTYAVNGLLREEEVLNERELSELRATLKQMQTLLADSREFYEFLLAQIDFRAQVQR